MKFFSIKKVFILFFSCVFFVAAKTSLADTALSESAEATSTKPSAVGYWQTIDDETGKARSIVKICQLKNNLLYGRVIQVNYNTGEKPTDVCDLCSKKDPRYDQLNLGIVFLTEMKQTFPNVWDDGNVLDPHNGKVYDAKITLAPTGNTLTLRGYLGVSLLGRSQTWNRVSDDTLRKMLGKIIAKNPAGYWVTSNAKFVAPNYDSCDVMQKEVDVMTNQANNTNSSSTN